ncbi:hypothetical protein U1Q18_023102, partial [Sarracenia purpurea var. burkii]
MEKLVTAVYKVNLHCPKCAHDITKPLLRTAGVQIVEAMFEKGEIRVRGFIDEKKIQKRIEKLSKRIVQILPPPAKEMETDLAEKTVKETKKVATTTIKVFMHCHKCEEDLRRKLLMHKGIHGVKSDMKSQTITIEGIVEAEKLLNYMKKKVHKHAEIVPPKPEKMEEKKEKMEEKKEEKKEKMEGKKEKVEEKKEEKKEKMEEKKEGKKEKMEEKKENEEKVSVEGKSTESRKVVEFKEEEKVEGNSAEGKIPYFVHYVYAPQLF